MRFWIAENHRKQGLGKALIHWIEKIAIQKVIRKGIGVDLYSDYGPAQKLYFKPGYIPYGNGVTYKYQATIPASVSFR